MRTDMDLATMDRELDRIHTAVVRAGQNLAQLEFHPTWMLLFTLDVDGDTLQRREQALWVLTDALVAHATVRDVIVAARAMRGHWRIATCSRLRRLDALLHGASVVLAARAVPVGGRGLVGESHVAIRVTPDEALAKMSAAFDEVMSFVADVEMRWGTIHLRLAETPHPPRRPSVP
jgi:hypothetical protein